MAEIAKVNTVSITHRKVDTGSYTGDNADNRQITTGFKCSIAYVKRRANTTQNMIAHANESFKWSDLTTLTGGSALHATDGFIVYKTTDNTNLTTVTYDYWAISE